MAEKIQVTRCDNCPVFENDVCKRGGMKAYPYEAPCGWAILGKRPEDFEFTAEDVADWQEWSREFQPDFYEERMIRNT